jgi:hypothetical protein
LLWRNDSERQRLLYRDDGKRVFPRRKFVEVDSERHDLFSAIDLERITLLWERGGLDGMRKEASRGLFI